MFDFTATLGRAAADTLRFGDTEREIFEEVRLALTGVDLATLPDGALDPTTGHPFR